MSDESVERSIGRLEGKMQELGSEVNRNREASKEAHEILLQRFESIATTVAEIRDVQTKTKGGMAMLAVLVSVAGTIGAAISWALNHLSVN